MQRMKFFIISAALIATCIFVFLTGCNINGNYEGTASINITGTAPILAKSRALTPDPSTANEIWAVSYNMGSWDLKDKQIATIDTSGHFSVGVPADSDRSVLLLVDTNQQRKIDQIVGYIAIGVDAEHNMLNFPASNATGDIDLGTVSKDTDSDQADEVKSNESDVNTVTENFDLTFEELKQMASNDKLLRSIKNWYANLDGDNWYGLNPVYMYTYNNLLSAKNNFLTPDTVFDLNNSANLEKEYTILYMTTVAADDPTKPEFGNSELSLYFPDGSYTVDAQDQNNTTGISIPAGARISTNSSLNEPSSLQAYDFWDQSGLGFFHGIVPDGQWVLKKDEVEIARYDLSTGDPFDSNGNIKVFVPAIKLNTIGDIVDSIDIQWYLYDESTGQYQPVDSTSKAFLDVVDYFDISLTDYSSNPAISENFEIGSSGGTVGGNLQLTDTHITPIEKTWTFSDQPGTGETHLTSLCVQYEIYGTRFMFDIRN